MKPDLPPSTAAADDGVRFDWRATAMVNPDYQLSNLTPEQLAAFLALAPGERARIALEMSDDLKRRELARIRAEHPDWIRLEIGREWIRLCFLPEPMPDWLVEQFQADIDAEKQRSASGQNAPTPADLRFSKWISLD